MANNVVLSETQELLSAPETTVGVALTTGWRHRRFLPGGIKGFASILKKVADESVGPSMQFSKGDVVGLDIKPSITSLLCKDVVDDFGPGIVRGLEKFNGGGIRFFPTAVTSTAFTVAASGALTQSMLVYARGHATPGNNGLFVVGASSTSVAIKCSGLAAETVSPTGSAIVEVCGFQFAAGDLQLDASGNLTCTTADFTTFGLIAGQDIGVGGATGGLLVFTNAVYRGTARIVSIAAKKITLERRSWVVGSGTADASTTVQLIWGSFLRNVAITHADYSTPSWSMETSQVGSGTAGGTQYLDALGNTVAATTIDCPLEGQVKITVDFIGTYCGKPVDSGSRIAGPSSATPSVAFGPINTVGDEKTCTILDLSENSISADVNNWKLMLGTNAAGRKVQGTLGNKDVTQGKYEVKNELTLFLAPGGVQAAAFDNTTVQFTARFANGDGAIVIDIPEGTITLADPQAAANGPITVAATLSGHQSAKYGHTCGITRFPYWPY